MKKVRAFTLIELLIVVAIIAILAAIAVPNFLEAQVRSKVSRARSDMRSLATGLESYYLDTNTYPAMTLTFTASADAYLGSPANPGVGNFGRTFRLRNTTLLNTLTTPVAYITSYFSDPFADARGASFRYYTTGSGWILGSYGPDIDAAVGGDMGWGVGNIIVDLEPNSVETAYLDGESQPSLKLLTGQGGGASGRGSYTYDPTNGTISEGDVWRVRQ